MKRELFSVGVLSFIISQPFMAGSAFSHNHPEQHSHLATSNQPRIELTWYQDIVYDPSYTDIVRTSLDIYVPEPVVTDAPVVLFVHGGGFRGSDKAYYKDLGEKPAWFTTELGYIFVSTNFRFLPDGGYPNSVQDIATALDWISDNIEAYGGDPDNIILYSHATGNLQAALVATDESFLERTGNTLDLIKGIICVDGGFFDLRESSGGVVSRALPPGDEVKALASPMAHIEPNKGIPPFLIIYGGGGGNTQLQSEKMALILRQAGISATAVEFPSKDHFTVNEHVGVPSDATTIVIERFLDSL
jgi:arylformamidase